MIVMVQLVTTQNLTLMIVKLINHAFYKYILNLIPTAPFKMQQKSKFLYKRNNTNTLKKRYDLDITHAQKLFLSNRLLLEILRKYYEKKNIKL